MYEWTKKLHMYAGLLTFTAFVVWGVTGVHAVFLPGPGGYSPPEVSSQDERPYEAPGDLDDKQLARHVYERLDLPLAGGHYNVRRDEESNLAFFVFTANGRRDVTLLEDQGKVRVEYRRNSLFGYLSTMHTAHSRRGADDTPVRLWAIYNEFSTWAFAFMTFSGVYLWLATRPRMLWAQLSFGGALLVSAVLWFAGR